jgi:hypothetical protein
VGAALVIRSGPVASWRERRATAGPEASRVEAAGILAPPTASPGQVAPAPTTAEVAPVSSPTPEQPAMSLPSAAPAAAEKDRATPGRGGATTTASARAWVEIRAKPWAELKVDGKRKGYVQGSKTVPLPAGRHLIELKGPDGVPGAYPVQLVKGQTEKLQHPPAEHLPADH